MRLWRFKTQKGPAPDCPGHRCSIAFPTPEFRRAAFDSRGFTWEIPRKTSDPERALANLLVRDRLFTDEVLKDAAALQLRVIEVYGNLTVDEVMTRLAENLGLSTR